MSRRLNKCLIEFQESRTRRGSDHAISKNEKSGWRSARDLRDNDLDNTREVFKKSMDKTFFHNMPDHRRDSDLQSIPGSCESDRQKKQHREADRQHSHSHIEQFRQRMHFLRNRKHQEAILKQEQKSPIHRPLLINSNSKVVFADPAIHHFNKSGSLIDQLRNNLKKNSQHFRDKTFRFERDQGIASKGHSKLLTHFREQKVQPSFRPAKIEDLKPSGRSPIPRTINSSLAKPKFNASSTLTKSSPDTAQIFRTQIHSIIKYNVFPNSQDRTTEKEKTKKIIQRMIQNLGVK